jgi:hypothetical protein
MTLRRGRTATGSKHTAREHTAAALKTKAALNRVR